MTVEKIIDFIDKESPDWDYDSWKMLSDYVKEMEGIVQASVIIEHYKGNYPWQNIKKR